MQQTSNLNIDFDVKSGRFMITCPPWDNGRIKALPNRRWSKARNQWTAPAIRANVEALSSLFPRESFTERALGKLDGYATGRANRSRSVTFPAWYGFKRQPRQKQREALEAVYGLPAFGLFMDMRTGKTKVLIDWACAMRLEGRINRLVIVCPLSIRRNWLREIGIDATIPVDAHLLDTKDKGKAFDRWMNTESDFKVLLVGVESLNQGSAIDYVKRFCVSHTRVALFIDESHAIKNPSASRSKKLQTLGRMCEYRGIATGSPLTKNPLDLYSQFEFLDPDIIGLGDFYSFKARYAIMGGYENKAVIGFDNLDELVELVSPYIYQVRQGEVFESSKEYVVREVELTPQQKSIYADLKKLSRTDVAEGSLTVQNVLEKMLRLQEVVGGFVSLEHTQSELDNLRQKLGPTAKLPRTRRVPIEGPCPKLNDLLQATEEYDGQTIIWCAFRNEIEMVAAALREKYGEDQVVEIHGGVAEADRDRNVQELFQTKKARFIVGNTATGGVGLTLDAGDNLFYYSNTFNFGDRMQSEERATKAGKQVLVVDFIAKGTVDELIVRANTEKQDIAEFIRGSIAEFKRAGTIDTPTAP